MPSPDPFLRHLHECNQATLPGNRTLFRLAGKKAGWIDPVLAPTLAQSDSIRQTEAGFALDDPGQLEALGNTLANQGLYKPHNELFDVAPDPDSDRAEARIDRGALPLFGFRARGVHMNGLVRRKDGLFLWVGHRAATKRLDPGKLDHLVAGGVSAGLSPDEALRKEAAEEASMPADIVARASHTARLVYTIARPEGLRRDILHCYDLELPETFHPAPADGEVDHFSLMSIHEVFERVRDTNDFKFNVNLVLTDLFLRERLIDPDSTTGQELRRGLDNGLVPEPD
ncbi:NUDIX domain-containing protein [Acetobacter sp. AN02]|uniref:NUDIX hydrolase n=1 Tax=Acetobacter sp. AN02 TaxID=2894186 RepID=UPI0024340E5C|nr:NUDIX domain-containing protein [Acetobacter sp. AN02]MDG6094459.1 NUDIX domain-containing protein [Acetobacter sp. AN02]